MAVAGDKFWFFACRAGDDDSYLKKGAPQGGFAESSRITPAEGAAMLGVNNMLMVLSNGEPRAFSRGAYQYMESFCRMNGVFWSSTGSAGCREGNEEEFICELARRYKNIRGAFLDDFAGMFSKLSPPDRKKEMLKTLRAIRAGLDAAPRKMELWITLYTHELDLFDDETARLIDGVTFWTWSCAELSRLPERYALLAEKFPAQKKLLGIYMLDYPTCLPVPNDLMELQCGFGLDMMKKGRADGMVFLTNCVMGVGLESEYFLRTWIDAVKNTPVPD